MTATISLTMIVRNEESNLADCLDSVKGEVDEIVIVDTGSTDNTIDIAGKYTDKIYHYQWDGDFSAARNFAISKASGQWILSLDADELLDTGSGTLKDTIRNCPYAETVFLPLCHSGSETAASSSRVFVMRLFRNIAEYRYKGIIHENIWIAKPDVMGYADAPVIWHKSSPGKLRNEKRNRNLILLRKALNNDPENPFLKYYMGMEWRGLGKTDQAILYFQQACDQLADNQSIFRTRAIRSLTLCLKNTGKLDEALRVCTDACVRYPMYTDIFFDAGTILEEKGDYEQAVKWFDSAVALGQPPVPFSHDNGTESFLAYHHLGYCYEQLKQYGKAETYYRQALETNPEYSYPLYSLFLRKITRLGAQDTFTYFKTLEYYSRPNWTKLLAYMFFEAGLPDLAAKCFDELTAVTDMPDICNQVRCMVYSGDYETALKVIETARNNHASIDVDMELNEIIAFILAKNYDMARRQTLQMWRDPAKRNMSWALLTILSRFNCGGRYDKPEKSREAAVVQTILTIAEHCLRYRSRYRGTEEAHSQMYSQLFQIALDIITQLSSDSNASLAAYLQTKANMIRGISDYKYKLARGLYL